MYESRVNNYLSKFKEYCYYHPEEIAVTVCERCGKSICLIERRYYRKQHTDYFREKTYYTNHEYCVFCNASQLRHDASFLNIFLFPIIIFILCMTPIVYFYNYGFFNSTFTIIYVSIIFVIFILYPLTAFKKARVKAEDAEVDSNRVRSRIQANKESFIEFIPAVKTYNSNISESDLVIIICNKCGCKIALKDKFCQNCGFPTHTEVVNNYE